MILQKQYLLLALLTLTIICNGQDNNTTQNHPQHKKLFDIIYLAQVASANGQHNQALQTSL